MFERDQPSDMTDPMPDELGAAGSNRKAIDGVMTGVGRLISWIQYYPYFVAGALMVFCSLLMTPSRVFYPLRDGDLTLAMTNAILLGLFLFIPGLVITLWSVTMVKLSRMESGLRGGRRNDGPVDLTGRLLADNGRALRELMKDCPDLESERVPTNPAGGRS